jgi:hypothetical protein
MGNTLCGHAAAAAADGDDGGQAAVGGRGRQRRLGSGAAAAPADTMAGGTAHQQQQQQQEQLPEDVSRALQAARQELDAALSAAPGRRFASDYAPGVVIGSGAFATVQACMHTASGQQFAVKVVPKQAGAADKQREGGFILGGWWVVRGVSAGAAGVWRAFLAQRLCVACSPHLACHTSAHTLTHTTQASSGRWPSCGCWRRTRRWWR